jgi:hypothetical protein
MPAANALWVPGFQPLRKFMRVETNGPAYPETRDKPLRRQTVNVLWCNFQEPGNFPHFESR